MGEELLLNGYRISNWSDEKSLKMDSSYSTTLSMYLMPLNCIFKISLNTNLCYIYYHNKKKEFHSSFIHIDPNLKSPDVHQ